MANGCDGAGATGLNNTSTDVEEPAGCEPTSDNFLKAVDMEEGKSYALLINNFSSTGAGVNLDSEEQVNSRVQILSFPL